MKRELALRIFDYLTEQGVQSLLRATHVPKLLPKQQWYIAITYVKDFDRIVEIHEHLKHEFQCTIITTVSSSDLLVVPIDTSRLIYR